MSRTAIACTTIASLSAVAIAALLALGPLNPPSGAVSSTNKTLAEVEPRIAVNATNTPGNATALFRITAPGSYFLTGNITGVVGKHGIVIEASGVTLDLNGFDLVGVPGMGAFDGVSASVAAQTNIAVFNGSVRGWGDDGIDLATAGVSGCRVYDISVVGNLRSGIVAGTLATISRCTASGGITGISVDNSSVISHCTATQVAGTGIFASNGGVVTHCSALSNTGNGITVGGTGVISNCSAEGNLNGITSGGSSSIIDCTVRINTVNGISVSTGCTVRGNTCSFNGNGGDGAGILASSSDNRIEGNNCFGADRGVDVNGIGNIIIRNTCSGNTTNWDIAANNVCGPILDRTAPGSASISGNVAPSSLGSTDPNANFSF